MPRHLRARIGDYAIAAAAVGLAALVRLLFEPALGPRQPYFTFYVSILFSALYLGVGPAVLATALGLVAGSALFVIPEPDLGAADVIGLFTYLLTSGAIVWICETDRLLRSRAESEASERRRAEASERRQRERLEAILASLGEGVIVASADGRVIKLNPIAERLTGWPAAEAVGRPLAEVFHTRDRRTTRTDELPVAALLGGAFVHRTGEPSLLIRRDGSGVPVEASSAAIRDDGQGGLVVVLRDASERLRAEQRERAGRERLRLALEAGRLGAWDWDLRSGAVHWAESSMAWFGLPAGSCDGTIEAVRSLIHPDDREAVRGRLRRAIEDGGRYEAEFRVRRPDGSVVWVADRGAVLRDDEGRPVRVIGVSTEITDRKRDEDALRASERHFRLLADAVPQIVWTSPGDGTIEYFNRRWWDYVGLEPEAPVPVDRWREVIHPDDFPELVGRWSEAERSGGVFEAEYRLRDAGGAYRWHLGRAVPIRDEAGAVTGWIGSATDIDDRKRAERTLRLLADAGILLADPTDLEGTLGRLPRLVIPRLADSCVVYLIDPDGSIRRVAIAHRDPAIQALMAEQLVASEIDPDGPSPVAEVLRTGRPDLRPAIDRPTIDDLLKDPVARERLRPAWPTSHLIVPMVVAGRTIGAFGLAMTGGDRRFSADDLPVAEDLARRAAIALENARLYRELREADRRKTEFLAVLAHELRNPLAPIRTALELLKRPDGALADAPEAADHEAFRAMAADQVAHMARLIEDLMDVTRISRGTIELRREPVELTALARRVVSAVGTQLAEADQSLAIDLPGEPLWLLADPVRVEQILWNLLTNAARYSDPGGRITLEIAPEDGEAVIRVRDTGIGIDPRQMARIFELFAQADQGPGRSRGGLGIGLSLVRTLVDLHGGTIVGQSDGPGTGSEFVVRLPRIAVPEPAAPAPASPARADGRAIDGAGGRPGGPAAAPRRRRILLVDDNRDAAVALGRLLGKLGGHDVRLAHDGPEALRAAAEFVPDVVLLDIGLPGMDGYEVARRLRASPEGASVLLIALTGWGQQEDYRRSREVGFDHHLVKPADSEVIERIIATPRPPAARVAPNP